MTGLRPPPSREAPSRVIIRLLVLILLVVTAGIAVWGAVTNQRIGLVEHRGLSELDIETVRDIEGTQINVAQHGGGRTPIVLLHDIDVAGSVLWEQVAAILETEQRVVLIDLPGFGFSERITTEGSRHTVASMAEIVSAAVEPLGNSAVFAGVGLGGEVAAEIAVTKREIVAGLVMIDVDFYKRDGWRESVEKLPWIGRAATFAFETGGSFAFDFWAPNCEDGGWCPSQTQVEARNMAEEVRGSTESIQAFRTTPASSLVPSKLSDIAAPTIFIWSDEGDVPRESVDEAMAALSEGTLEVRSSWKAHLDDPQAVADLIESLIP
jgi:pimeloyl-ACP methyl ester carboxylesterase